jgi:hypothetical protein
MSGLFSFFDFSLGSLAAVVLAAALLVSYDLSERLKQHKTHILFAGIFGSILSLALIKITLFLFQPEIRENAHVMALGILLIVLLWRSLFGPWTPRAKAIVLGTFVFWIALNIFTSDSSENHTVRIIAAITAVIPAIIWCMLFLEYHKEKLSHVFLMFFTGMVATVPILFYDALVRRGIEFQFFVFRLVPESFNKSAQQFVSGQVIGISSIHTTMLSVFISFIIVGAIEEISKYWVLRRSGQPIFSSIDDVIQLSIIVAIGFSFAENISNPGYFMGFVREYLLTPASPDIIGFLSNVIGRSVMTSMVHIVSTGVMGYFLGLAIFADPLLEEAHKKGRTYHIVEWVHNLLHIKRRPIFRTQMIVMGVLSAITLHGLFNFLVTLPDLLPGNPRTLGDVFGMGESSWLHYVAILLIPALFYVVGGFWVLTGLFLQKENIEERGHLVRKEVFVKNITA